MPGLQEIFTPMLIINGSCTQIQKTCQKPITLVGSKYGNHSSIALWKRGGEEKLNSSGCFCPVWRVPGWHLMASVALLTVPSSYWYVVIRSVGEITWDVLLAGDWGEFSLHVVHVYDTPFFPFISGPTTPIQCSSVGVVTVSAWEIIILSPSSESSYNCPEILCIFSDYFTSDLINFTGLSWEVLLGALHY